MAPVRKAAVVDFLEWLRTNTEFRSIVRLSKSQFMSLVEKYELSKGVDAILSDHSNLRMKWEVAFDHHLSRHSSDEEALARYPNW